MKKAKFSLADLFTVLGSLVFGFLFYLSMNFITLGDSKISILYSILVSLFVGGLAFGTKLFKCSYVNFKTKIIWERMFFVLFIMAALLVFNIFSHYFYVTSHKAQIQEKVVANIKQAEGMFAAYESFADNRIVMYEETLKSAVNGKTNNLSEYRKYGFVDGQAADTFQLENKVFTLKKKLFPNNYSEMKKIDSTWLAESKSKIENWSPTGTVKVIMGVESELTSWKNTLVKNSEWRAPGESANNFDFPLVFSDVSNMMKDSGTPTPYAIASALVLYILMMLSYFISPRSSKNPYTLFGKRKIKKNSDIDIDF